jgi:hypothetical protein
VKIPSLQYSFTVIPLHWVCVTYLLKSSSDDCDPVFDSRDAIRMADTQDDFSHGYRCIYIHLLFFHFLHEFLNKQESNLKKSTLSIPLIYTERGKKFQGFFSPTCVNPGLLKHLGVSGIFYLILKDVGKVRGVSKNDFFCYR